jgi:hypothetical protein
VGRTRGALRCLAICIAICAALGSAGLAAASSWPTVPVPDSHPGRSEAVHFAAAAAGPRTLRIAAESGYCVGDRYLPKIERVEMHLHRRPGHRFRAVLRVIVRRPVEPVPPPAHAQNGESPNAGYYCAGVGYYLQRKIELPRPLDRVGVFDGSFAPARHVVIRHS